MPKVITQQELDHLVALIGAQPEGIGIDALLQSLGGSVQRRTLQRRLAVLAGLGRIQMRGEARAVRYVAPPANRMVADLQANGYQGADHVVSGRGHD